MYERIDEPYSPIALPSLPLEDWKDTKETFHRYAQIVGKVRLECFPYRNHWWNVPLYVTSCGLTTGPNPYGDETFEISFDFIAHELQIVTSAGGRVSFALEDGLSEALEWNNAEQVIARGDEDIVQFINDLKAQPGGDIHLAGGARLAQSIIRLGLVDEYRLFVHPVVSAGATWFDQIEDERGMDLKSAIAYENGVVGLYYKPKKDFRSTRWQPARVGREK